MSLALGSVPALGAESGAKDAAFGAVGHPRASSGAKEEASGSLFDSASRSCSFTIGAGDALEGLSY